jgi:hypothetical protein
MPTRFWGVINIVAAANAANEAASAAADVIGSPAAVKIFGSMISLPSSFVFFHDLISLPGCKAAEVQRRRATTLQFAPLASTFNSKHCFKFHWRRTPLWDKCLRPARLGSGFIDAILLSLRNRSIAAENWVLLMP